MTTADAPTEPKKGHSILDAMKRGREYATAFVLIMSFLHSLYASYFKPEKVAEAGYKTMSEAMENYSVRVHDELEALKARVQELEAEVAKAPAPAHVVPFKEADKPRLRVQLKVNDGDGIPDTEPIDASDVFDDLAAVEAPTTTAPADDGLIIDLPDAPLVMK